MKRSSDQLRVALKKTDLLVGEESGHINKIMFMENSGIFWKSISFDFNN